MTQDSWAQGIDSDNFGLKSGRYIPSKVKGIFKRTAERLSENTGEINESKGEREGRGRERMRKNLHIVLFQYFSTPFVQNNTLAMRRGSFLLCDIIHLTSF